MPRESLFSKTEFQELLGRIVKECRREVLKEGKLGKRGFSADSKALRACISRKIKEAKMKKLQEKLSSI